MAIAGMVWDRVPFLGATDAAILASGLAAHAAHVGRPPSRYRVRRWIGEAKHAAHDILVAHRVTVCRLGQKLAEKGHLSRAETARTVLRSEPALRPTLRRRPRFAHRVLVLAKYVERHQWILARPTGLTKLVRLAQRAVAQRGTKQEREGAP